MKIRKVIRKRIRHRSDGINVAGDVNGTIAADVNESGSRTNISSRSRRRIVQRSGGDDERNERR